MKQPNILQRLMLRGLGMKEIANNLLAVGLPNQNVAADAADQNVAGGIEAFTGSATERMRLTIKEIPKIDDIDSLVSYIKKFRAQVKVRSVLDEAAALVADDFRLRGTQEVERVAVTQRLSARVKQMALDCLTIGWYVVYSSEDPKLPPTLTILHNVGIKRDIQGGDVIYLQLTDTTKAAIKQYPQAYPQYWAQQVDNPSGINISRLYDAGGKLTQGGAYLVRIGGDDEDVLPVPPIYPWLPNGVFTEQISDQIGSYCDMIKWYLIHAQVGDKQGSDHRDGRPKPPTNKRMQQIFQDISLDIGLVHWFLPSDVEIKTQIQTDSPFAVIRNDTKDALEGLRRNIGIPDFGSVSSEGAAMFMARAAMPTVKHVRRCITEQFLLPWLYDLASQGRLNGADQARVIWGDSLQDMTAKINLAKFKLSTGGYSLQTICESIDPDYSLQREIPLKQFELQNKEFIGNIYEANQGTSVKSVEATTTSTDGSSNTEDGNSNSNTKTPKQDASTTKTAKASKPIPTAVDDGSDSGGRPPK